MDKALGVSRYRVARWPSQLGLCGNGDTGLPSKWGTMAGLKHTATTVMSVLATLTYQLKNLVTGSKPVHVVVCGPDDQAAKALLELVPGLFSAKDVSVVWGQALWAESVRSRVIVSWDPDDAARWNVIEKTLSPTRHIVYLLAVADPQELVSERSPDLPHHYTQGADYRLHVDERTLSFTQPGVMPRCQDVREVMTLGASRVAVIRREDFHEHPEKNYGAILNLVGQHGGPTPRSTEKPGPLPGLAQRSPYSEDPARVARVVSQRQRFPELDEVAKDLGYELFPLPAPPATVSPRGLIVAFHTPDKVYQAEAERLRKSLDALGLDYEISEVEPESNWVRTTLLKPTWIAPARKKHRGPLLYVDVDAYVHNDPWPYVADMEADMAAVVYKNGQLNSATLWLNDTPGAKLILSQWAAGAGDRRGADQGDLEDTGDNGDQGVLKLVVEAEERKTNPEFRFGRLPPNLATIFDRTDEYRYGPVVIEQLQVSREVTKRSKRLSRRHDRLKELSN
jgi:hypothetical protein